MVFQAPTPTPEGTTRQPPSRASSLPISIMMVDYVIGILTQSKNYDPPEGDSLLKDPSLTFESNGTLTFDTPSFKR